MKRIIVATTGCVACLAGYLVWFYFGTMPAITYGMPSFGYRMPVRLVYDNPLRLAVDIFMLLIDQARRATWP